MTESLTYDVGYCYDADMDSDTGTTRVQRVQAADAQDAEQQVMRMHPSCIVLYVDAA